ncbi:extracellular solute-binding protein [Gorillibacterium timonense]|uniref:extracellular solute-binding protein n=1 Tax=Gorillibacterium timonense TaxID=1689269 RepID=UPI00071C6996|nr:extracellular solute-binding protein [Gorillibacterium timonense]
MSFGWPKRIQAAILPLLSLLLLGGCGESGFISDPDKVASIKESTETTIEYWHTYSDEETRLLEQEIIPAFEREHPAIHIKAVRQANNTELKNTLITRAASHRGPDVVRMDIAWIPEFIHKKLLTPLEANPGFMETREALRSDVMELGEQEGHSYSLPLNVNTKIAIYNRVLLEKAGLSGPPASLRDALTAAERTHSRIGIGGLDAWRLMPYLYALGGSFLDDTYSQASGYLNGPATVKAVGELVDYYRKGVIDPLIVKGGGDLWAGVKGGNILMTDEGPWFYSVLDAPELSLAMRVTQRAPMPSLSSGLTASIVGGENLVLLRNTQAAEDAWVFMKWLTESDAQLTMAKTGQIPTNLEAMKKLSYEKNSYTTPYLEALQNSFIRPPIPNWSEVDRVFWLGMKRIFQEEVPVQEGLDQLAAQLDSMLQQ